MYLKEQNKASYGYKVLLTLLGISKAPLVNVSRAHTRLETSDLCLEMGGGAVHPLSFQLLSLKEKSTQDEQLRHCQLPDQSGARVQIPLQVLSLMYEDFAKR